MVRQIGVIKNLKCKTVAEGRFGTPTISAICPYRRRTPALLGDDTANPSEASLAALGSCLAVGCTPTQCIAADGPQAGTGAGRRLNITAVWGTACQRKAGGFTNVRVKAAMECDGVPQREIDALIAHVTKWSPVANTFARPVNLSVTLA